MIINVFYLSKYYFMKYVNRLYARDYISYRRRKQIKICLAFGFEILNFVWQVYGNFIYYEWRGIDEENDQDFSRCMEERNNGFVFSMFMLLMLGYCTIILYLLILLFYVVMMLRSYRRRNDR